MGTYFFEHTRPHSVAILWPFSFRQLPLFFLGSHHHDAPRRLLLLTRQSNHTLTLAAAGPILHRSSAVPVMDDIGAFLPSASYFLPSFVYFSSVPSAGRQIPWFCTCRLTEEARTSS